MATTKLALYNGALRHIGQGKLAAIDEAVENRRLLDDIYDDNAINTVLEMGLWNFAMRTVKLEYDSTVDPDFGLRRGFAKPSDWVRTAQAASDEYFTTPLIDQEFNDEQAYFFADIDTIYLRYVSDDNAYGSDLSIWPNSFVKCFQWYMAWELVPRIAENKTAQDEVWKMLQDQLKNARSKDAQNEGIKFPPASGWAMARGSGRRGRRDLGSRSSLTG
jgi:hypothetical protein